MCERMCVLVCVRRGLERAGQARRGLALVASEGLAGRGSLPPRTWQVPPSFVPGFGSLQSGWKSFGFFPPFLCFACQPGHGNKCNSSPPHYRPPSVPRRALNNTPSARPSSGHTEGSRGPETALPPDAHIRGPPHPRVPLGCLRGSVTGWGRGGPAAGSPQRGGPRSLALERSREGAGRGHVGTGGAAGTV